MKSTLYALIMLIMVGCFSAHGADGFAMIAGTTTGGGNGSTTTVTTAAAFSNAVVSGGGVVQVQGTINLNLAGIGYMPIAGNQTILGLSTNATVIGNLQVESGNVILRNLFISNPNSNGEGDGLSVSRTANHIWIDHCTFSNCLDGEVDITKGADYVTVSWCKFLYTTNFGHNFPNLIGDANSGTPDTNRLHVTFHHNWWSELCIERMPRVRFGRIHSYNNYFNTAVNGNAFTNSHCVTAALYSEVRLENNHFENVRNPWDLNITDGATTGKIYAAGNAFVNVTNIPSPPTVVIPPGTDTVFAVPYCYILDNTNSLAAIVTNSAGAGQPAYDLTTNSWTGGSGKWENSSNWSLDAAPSLSDYANLITIGNSNTVTIDAATANASTTMTISNLTLSGSVCGTNTLFLDDAGTNTPLRVLNSFTINSGGALMVTNAALRVEGVLGGDFLIDGGVTLLNGASAVATNAGVLTSIGDTASGSLTMNGGSWLARDVIVGNLAGSQGTLTMAGGTNALIGPLTVGGLGTGTVWVTGGQLVVTNRPDLVGAGSGFIVDGSVTVNEGSSIIVSNVATIIGNVGSGSLIIKSGAVYSSSGVLGLNVSSSSNTVLVTGPGSVWSNSFNQFVGYSGAGNQLTIANGAIMYNDFGYLGSFVSSSSNTVLVTGPSSVWNNGADLYVGDVGAGNQLTITNGATVNNDNGFLRSSSNTVLVTGPGSVWSNRLILYVGYSGAGNQLTIANGATVYNIFWGYLGYNSFSSSNTVLVTGPGSVWSNGYELSVGYGGGGNQLTITNGAAVYSYAGYLGAISSSSSNTVLVTGPGSVWNNDLALYVGYSGAGNHLTIANGATVYGDEGFLGVNVPSSNNTVLVTDPGSVWSNGFSLSVGGSGARNQLIVTNGATVYSYRGYLGNSSSSSNNVAIVSGSGSVWKNASSLTVGVGLGSNTLTVADSGSVISTNQLLIGESYFCGLALVQVNGGNVTVTNAVGTAVLEVRSGTLTLNSGTLKVDTFVMTNACGVFTRTGGTLIYGTAVLDPARDDDGDGISNGYEQSHSLDPLNSADANIDSDGDGFTNLQEFQTGTDATNNASFFGITAIVKTNIDIRVTWMTGIGKTNALERTAGTANGSYSNNFSPIFTVTNTVAPSTNYLDLGAATNVPSFYYRVRLVP